MYIVHFNKDIFNLHSIFYIYIIHQGWKFESLTPNPMFQLLEHLATFPFIASRCNKCKRNYLTIECSKQADQPPKYWNIKVEYMTNDWKYLSYSQKIEIIQKFRFLPVHTKQQKPPFLGPFPPQSQNKINTSFI